MNKEFEEIILNEDDLEHLNCATIFHPLYFYDDYENCRKTLVEDYNLMRPFDGHPDTRAHEYTQKGIAYMNWRNERNR